MPHKQIVVEVAVADTRAGGTVPAQVNGNLLKPQLTGRLVLRNREQPEPIQVAQALRGAVLHAADVSSPTIAAAEQNDKRRNFNQGPHCLIGQCLKDHSPGPITNLS